MVKAPQKLRIAPPLLQDALDHTEGFQPGGPTWPERLAMPPSPERAQQNVGTEAHRKFVTGRQANPIGARRTSLSPPRIWPIATCLRFSIATAATLRWRWPRPQPRSPGRCLHGCRRCRGTPCVDVVVLHESTTGCPNPRRSCPSVLYSDERGSIRPAPRRPRARARGRRHLLAVGLRCARPRPPRSGAAPAPDDPALVARWAWRPAVPSPRLAEAIWNTSRSWLLLCPIMSSTKAPQRDRGRVPGAAVFRGQAQTLFHHAWPKVAAPKQSDGNSSPVSALSPMSRSSGRRAPGGKKTSAAASSVAVPNGCRPAPAAAHATRPRRALFQRHPPLRGVVVSAMITA